KKESSEILCVSMKLLYDTQKLRTSLNKDEKAKRERGKMDTFKKDGYESVSLYTKRLIDMYKYEFGIKAAKALFGKIPDDYKLCDLRRVRNKNFRDSADKGLNEDDSELNEDDNKLNEDGGELNEGDGGLNGEDDEVNGDSEDVDKSSAEDWIFIGDAEMYNRNDIVVAVITKSFGDETGSKRYIGCLSHIFRIPQSRLCQYILTFNAQISPSQNIKVLMWTIENLTSYKRVVKSLSDGDAMRSIPELFLKGPMTDASPLTDDTIDIQDGVPESMNPMQKIAISRAIQEDGDKVVLIQGPPGCGKSTVIAEIIHLLTTHDRGNAGMRVLACAQTNVAVVDLAYKYVTTKKPKDKFACVMDMKLPKITDSRKRVVLEPFTIIARYHQVVNAVLHTVIRVFGRTPTACHGSTTKDGVKNIVAADFNACVESGLIELLPPRAHTLLMFTEVTLSDSELPSTDLAQVKSLVLGMRNELELFFEPVDLKSLLELCSVNQHTGTSPRSKPISIYG
ncbi:DNA-binding protein SMUBP-2, partial [Lobosporangium transversale]